MAMKPFSESSTLTRGASLPLDGRFLAMERDPDGALYVSVELRSGDAPVRCFMRDSFVRLSFRPLPFWYATFMVEGGETAVCLRNEDYFRFRAALRLAIQKTDVYC